MNVNVVIAVNSITTKQVKNTQNKYMRENRDISENVENNLYTHIIYIETIIIVSI